MKKIVVLFVSILFFASCDEKGKCVYEKMYQFDNDLFTSDSILQFEFENGRDTFQLYDVELLILHKVDMPYMRIPLDLGYNSQRGTAEIPIAIPARDEHFNLIGELQPDSNSVLLTEKIFYGNSMSEGKNTFTLAPSAFFDTLKGIQAITLRIEEVN